MEANKMQTMGYLHFANIRFTLTRDISPYNSLFFQSQNEVLVWYFNKKNFKEKIIFETVAFR